MLEVNRGQTIRDKNTINIEGTVEKSKEWFLGKKKLKTD